MTPKDIVEAFVDTSILHSEVDSSFKLEDKAWMVYRWKLDFFSYPSWDQDLEASTLVNEVNKLFAYRHFFLQRGEDVLARGGSLWIMADLKTREAVSIPKDLHTKEEAPLETIPNRLIRRGSKDRIESPSILVPVTKEDLDVNGHVNNAVYIKYVKMALEDLDPGFVQGLSLRGLDITYSDEIRGQDQVLVAGQAGEDKTYSFTIWSQDGSKTHAYIKAKFA